MLEMRNVTVRIGQRAILQSVSATVRPGSLSVMVGPNGAGKSTFLKAATGEIRPDEGDVLFEGSRLDTHDPRYLATRRAVLPQSSALAFPSTVFEVVRLGLDARAGLSAAVRREAPLRALSAVDLRGFEGRRYQELSGGEQQRVHLARILCQIGEPMVEGRPQYLFLDEPTSSLDIRHQIAILKLAQDFARRGGAVFAILHDLNIAAAFADHIMVVHGGVLIREGSTAEVIDDWLPRDVFEVPLKVNAAPRDVPFVLPQSLSLPEKPVS